ncbi:hypothetical protein QR680_016631 [Steinernema hermaphroditum]|uniref:COX assembly mitochondrial protein n=1 Tax=Steinernema hermaphroditum TaxID=289476 RepID=A0AA39HBT3_9BILA|nr:hypothetical protein QR680_016631 [Steinernema hermaphroditum]
MNRNVDHTQPKRRPILRPNASTVGSKNSLLITVKTAPDRVKHSRLFLVARVLVPWSYYHVTFFHFRRGSAFRFGITVAPLLLLLYALGLLDRFFERSFDREFEWPPYIDIREYVVNKLLHNKSSSTIGSVYLFENDWALSRPLISPYCNASTVGSKNSLLIIVKTAPDRVKNRQAIRSTWASPVFSQHGGFDIRTIFVMGSSPSNADLLRQESKDYGDLLVGKFIDGYRNNTRKFIQSIGYAHDYCNRNVPHVKYNVPYVLLVDDDYLISIPNLIAEVKKFAPHERLYTGWRFDSSPFRFVFHKHRVSLSNYPFDRYPPYVSAGAVLLTHQTVREFYHAIEYVRQYPYDDVYAGILAYMLGIYVRHNERFQFWGSGVPLSEIGSVVAIHELAFMGADTPENAAATSSAEKLLKTDDLSALREGEIFVDEHGKKYRVKKTIMPHYSSAGPHGMGDPDDRTLRRIEADVIIPNRMNKQIEQVDCKELRMGLIECLREYGAVKGFNQCKAELALFNECKAERFHDIGFRQRMTDEYLAERSEARRTGMTTKERRLEEFRQWKAQNPEK